jgi:hypothetical protein
VLLDGGHALLCPPCIPSLKVASRKSDERPIRLQRQSSAQPHRRAGIFDLAGGRDGFGRHLVRRQRVVVFRQVDWADVIFVMEKTHRSKLARQFRSHLKGKRVVCLDIPDDYEFMDPELVRLLENRVGRFLPQASQMLR